MDNYWGNQGYSFFHEIYHYGGTVSVPQTEDRCYGAADCWEMAADPHRSTCEYHLAPGIFQFCRFKKNLGEAMLTLGCNRVGN